MADENVFIPDEENVFIPEVQPEGFLDKAKRFVKNIPSPINLSGEPEDAFVSSANAPISQDVITDLALKATPSGGEDVFTAPATNPPSFDAFSTKESKQRPVEERGAVSISAPRETSKEFGYAPEEMGIIGAQTPLPRPTSPNEAARSAMSIMLSEKLSKDYKQPISPAQVYENFDKITQDIGWRGTPTPEELNSFVLTSAIGGAVLGAGQVEPIAKSALLIRNIIGGIAGFMAAKENESILTQIIEGKGESIEFLANRELKSLISRELSPIESGAVDLAEFVWPIGLAKLGRTINNSVWFRSLTIPERELVVQSVSDMKQKGYTEKQILDNFPGTNVEQDAAKWVAETINDMSERGYSKEEIRQYFKSVGNQERPTRTDKHGEQSPLNAKDIVKEAAQEMGFVKKEKEPAPTPAPKVEDIQERSKSDLSDTIQQLRDSDTTPAGWSISGVAQNSTGTRNRIQVSAFDTGQFEDDAGTPRTIGLVFDEKGTFLSYTVDNNPVPSGIGKKVAKDGKTSAFTINDTDEILDRISGLEGKDVLTGEPSFNRQYVPTQKEALDYRRVVVPPVADRELKKVSERLDGRDLNPRICYDDVILSAQQYGDPNARIVFLDKQRGFGNKDTSDHAVLMDEAGNILSDIWSRKRKSYDPETKMVEYEDKGTYKLGFELTYKDFLDKYGRQQELLPRDIVPSPLGKGQVMPNQLDTLQQDIRERFIDWLSGRSLIAPKADRLYRGKYFKDTEAPEGYAHVTPWPMVANRGGQLVSSGDYFVETLPMEDGKLFYRGGSLAGDPLERTRINSIRGMTWEEALFQARKLYMKDLVKRLKEGKRFAKAQGEQLTEYDIDRIKRDVARDVFDDFYAATFEADLNNLPGIWRNREVIPKEIDKTYPSLRDRKKVARWAYEQYGQPFQLEFKNLLKGREEVYTMSGTTLRLKPKVKREKKGRTPKEVIVEDLNEGLEEGAFKPEEIDEVISSMPNLRDNKGRTLVDMSSGRYPEKTRTGDEYAKMTPAEAEAALELDKVEEAFHNHPLYIEKEQLWTDFNEYEKSISKDIAGLLEGKYDEQKKSMRAQIDLVTSKLYDTPESDAWFAAYRKLNKIRKGFVLEKQKIYDDSVRHKWHEPDTPWHGTDLDRLAGILEEGLNFGSALDFTPYKDWATAYPIQVIVPSARKGTYIAHNDFYQSDNVARAAKVIMDLDQYTDEAREESFEKFTALARNFPDVEFEVTHPGKKTVPTEIFEKSPETNAPSEAGWTRDIDADEGKTVMSVAMWGEDDGAAAKAVFTFKDGVLQSTRITFDDPNTKEQKIDLGHKMLRDGTTRKFSMTDPLDELMDRIEFAETKNDDGSISRVRRFTRERPNPSAQFSKDVRNIINIPNDSVPDGEKLGEIAGELKAHKKNLLQLVGSNMYSNYMAYVAVKELVQNAFDAIKTVQYKDPKYGVGRIDITYNDTDRTIQVSDDGCGMDLRIIEDSFFTVGGSEKDIPMYLRSGGFGLAKVGFMIGAEWVELDTVKAGTGVRYYVKATSKDIQDDNFKIQKFKAEKGEHGTRVRIKVPESYTDPNTGEVRPYYMPASKYDIAFLRQPLIGNVEVVLHDAYGAITTLPIGKHQDLSKTPKITTVHFNWGDAEVYFGEDYKPDDASHKVLSSGVHQFDKSFRFPLTDERIAYDIIIDFKLKVAPTDRAYPFTMDRERFRPAIDNDIAALTRYLARLARASESLELQKNFDNIVSIPRVDLTEGTYSDDIVAMWEQKYREAKERAAGKSVPSLEKLEKAELEVSISEAGDIINTVTKEIILDKKKFEKEIESSFKAEKDAPNREEFMKNMETTSLTTPIYHNNTNLDYIQIGREGGGKPELFFSELSSVFLDMRDNVVKLMAEEIGKAAGFYTGISIDKGYQGLYIIVPFKGLFLNPLSIKMGKTFLSLRENTMVAMVHELAHIKADDHNSYHDQVMQNITTVLADKGLYDSYRAMLDNIFSKHSETIMLMRRAYAKSSTKNIGKSFKDEKGSALEPPVTEYIEDDGGRGADGGDAGKPGAEPANVSGGAGLGGSKDISGSPGRVPEDRQRKGSGETDRKFCPALRIEGKVYVASVPDGTTHGMLWDSIPADTINRARKVESGWAYPDGTEFQRNMPKNTVFEKPSNVFDAFDIPPSLSIEDSLATKAAVRNTLRNLMEKGKVRQNTPAIITGIKDLYRLLDTGELPPNKRIQNLTKDGDIVGQGPNNEVAVAIILPKVKTPLPEQMQFVIGDIPAIFSYDELKQTSDNLKRIVGNGAEDNAQSEMQAAKGVEVEPKTKVILRRARNIIENERGLAGAVEPRRPTIGFFSKLEEVVNFKMPKQIMDKTQLFKMLRNNGVTDDEINMTLQGLPSRVTKKDVLEEIAVNGTRFINYWYEDPKNPANRSKYASFVEPGEDPGTYREILVSWDDPSRVNSAVPEMEDGREKFADWVEFDWRDRTINEIMYLERGRPVDYLNDRVEDIPEDVRGLFSGNIARFIQLNYDGVIQANGLVNFDRLDLPSSFVNDMLSMYGRFNSDRQYLEEKLELDMNMPENNLDYLVNIFGRGKDGLPPWSVSTYTDFMSAYRYLHTRGLLDEAGYLTMDKLIHGKNQKLLPPRWRDGHQGYEKVPNPVVRLRFNLRTINGETWVFLEESQGPKTDFQYIMPNVKYTAYKYDDPNLGMTTYFVPSYVRIPGDEWLSVRKEVDYKQFVRDPSQDYTEDIKIGYEYEAREFCEDNSISFKSLIKKDFGEQAKMIPELQARIHDIGIKRILAYAKENNLAGVLLTTGDMQNRRYNLSTYIDTLVTERNGNSYTLLGIKDEEDVVHRTCEKEELVGMIGPDLARKVIKFHENDTTKLRDKYTELPTDVKIGRNASDTAWLATLTQTDANGQSYEWHLSGPQATVEHAKAAALKELNAERNRVIASEQGQFRGLDLEVMHEGTGLKELYDKWLPGLLEKYSKNKLETVDLYADARKEGALIQRATNPPPYLLEGLAYMEDIHTGMEGWWNSLPIEYRIELLHKYDGSTKAFDEPTPVKGVRVNEKTPYNFTLYSDPFGLQSFWELASAGSKDIKQLVGWMRENGYIVEPYMPSDTALPKAQDGALPENDPKLILAKDLPIHAEYMSPHLWFSPRFSLMDRPDIDLQRMHMEAIENIRNSGRFAKHVLKDIPDAEAAIIKAVKPLFDENRELIKTYQSLLDEKNDYKRQLDNIPKSAEHDKLLRKISKLQTKLKRIDDKIAEFESPEARDEWLLKKADRVKRLTAKLDKLKRAGSKQRAVDVFNALEKMKERTYESKGKSLLAARTRIERQIDLRKAKVQEIRNTWQRVQDYVDLKNKIKDVDSKMFDMTRRAKEGEPKSPFQIMAEKFDVILIELARKYSDVRVYLAASDELPDGIGLSPGETWSANMLRKFMKMKQDRLEKAGIAVIKEKAYMTHLWQALVDDYAGSIIMGKFKNKPTLLSFYSRLPDSRPWIPSANATMRAYIPVVEFKIAYQKFLDRWRMFIDTCQEPGLKKYMNSWVSEQMGRQDIDTFEKMVNIAISLEYARTIGLSLAVAIKHGMKLLGTPAEYGLLATLKAIPQVVVVPYQSVMEFGQMNFSTFAKICEKMGIAQEKNQLRLFRHYIAQSDLVRMLTEIPNFERLDNAVFSPEFKYTGGKIVKTAQKAIGRILSQPVKVVETIENGVSVFAGALAGKAKGIDPKIIERRIWEAIFDVNFRAGVDQPLKQKKSSGFRTISMFQMTPLKLQERLYKWVHDAIAMKRNAEGKWEFGKRDAFGTHGFYKLLRFFLLVGVAETIARENDTSVLGIAVAHLPFIGEVFEPRSDSPWGFRLRGWPSHENPPIKPMTASPLIDWAKKLNEFGVLQGTKEHWKGGFNFMMKLDKAATDTYPTKYDSALKYMTGLPRIQNLNDLVTVKEMEFERKKEQRATLDELALRAGKGDKSAIREGIAQIMKEPEPEREGLAEKFLKDIQVYQTKHANWWKDLRRLTPEKQAQVFFHEYTKATPEGKKQMLKDAAKVSEFSSERFNEAMAKEVKAYRSGKH